MSSLAVPPEPPPRTEQAPDPQARDTLAGKAPSATDTAIGRLRHMLLDGSLSPGEQIRQHDMAELLAVSRVPLREALNVLANEGLLQHRLHAGYFVPRRSAAEIRQILRMLELLENELLATIEWPDAATLAGLRQLNNDMRAVTRQHDWGQLVQLNHQLHFRIFALSPDALVLSEVQRLWLLANSLIGQKIAHPEAAMRTIAEHEALLDTIEQRDRVSCRARMAEHRVGTRPKNLSVNG